MLTFGLSFVERGVVESTIFRVQSPHPSHFQLSQFTENNAQSPNRPLRSVGAYLPSAMWNFSQFVRGLVLTSAVVISFTAFAQLDSTFNTTKITAQTSADSLHAKIRETSIYQKQKAKAIVRELHKTKRISGTLEGGIVHGQPPLTYPQSNNWSALLKGGVRTTVAGLPIQLDVDLGSATPVRGRRNNLRLSLNVNEITERSRLAETVELDGARRKLQVLRTQQTDVRRKLNMRISGVKESFSDTIPYSSGHLADTTIPKVEKDTVGLKAAMPVGKNLPSVSEDTVQGSLSGTFGTDSLQIDSSRNDSSLIESSRRHLEQINGQIDSLSTIERRLTAMVNSRKDVPSGLKGILAGIRAVEIGECSPNSHEFLMRDLSIQGFYTEVLRKDLYLSIVHGRSFDDTWRTLDPGESRSRYLQQTAFLTPSRDLNPRRLSSLTLGYGAPESDHCHFGVLLGRRFLTSPGVPVLPEAYELRNLVVSADIGLLVWKHHMVRISTATSSDNGGSASDSGDEGWHSDLFNSREQSNSALKVGLQSSLTKTGTLLEADWRTIGADFHSMGLGFVRNNSHSTTISGTQRISAKIQVRFRGTDEQRNNSVSGAKVHLQRGQFTLRIKPSSTFGFNVNAQPVFATTQLADGRCIVQENLVLGVGTQWRKRLKHISASGSAQIDRYAFATTQESQPVTWCGSASLSLQSEKGTSGTLTWTSTLANDSSATQYCSGNCRLPVDKRSSCEAFIATNLLDLRNASAGCGYKRSITDHLWVAFRLDRYRDAPQMFSSEIGSEQEDVYNWSVNIGCQW